ncbi:hypothetical protein HPB48_013110 [Haemaphysalis longicornis]|uniref:Uncharacterized protein n=1 Tax=Haemaphysalis longicornis TaxID=44386 RepID=A0A9J6GY43_HAELO|nr:hypothetical protein HPB48_013110 [Haemaphysalis longicornis]
MPTCAELAKRIKVLESAFKEQLETAVKEVKAEAGKTLDDKGLEEHAKLCESVKFLSAQYDSMRVKQDALIAENKALRAHNESLETRLAELEQYSRQNNIEIKGVPTTKGEDCTAFLNIPPRQSIVGLSLAARSVVPHNNAQRIATASSPMGSSKMTLQTGKTWGLSKPA